MQGMLLGYMAYAKTLSHFGMQRNPDRTAQSAKTLPGYSIYIPQGRYPRIARSKASCYNRYSILVLLKGRPFPRDRADIFVLHLGELRRYLSELKKKGPLKLTRPLIAGSLDSSIICFTTCAEPLSRYLVVSQIVEALDRVSIHPHT